MVQLCTHEYVSQTRKSAIWVTIGNERQTAPCSLRVDRGAVACCIEKKKTVQICFALFDIILQQSHRRKDEDGWRDAVPLNYLNDKSASKQRRHAFDLQKSWTRRSHSEQHQSNTSLAICQKKKTHRLTHTQVVAHGSKNVEMAKMKNLLFARAVTVTGEIPF